MNKIDAVEKQVSESEVFIRFLDQKIDGLSVPSEFRCRMAGGALDVALEHHKAIVLLIANHLPGSAFAILRLLFESFVVGVWMQQCATIKQLNAYKKKGTQKKFFQLINEVEKIDGFKAGVLSAAKTKSWAAMNDYTHTGFRQIVRRNKESSIEPNYEDAELLEVLAFADAIGALAAIQIAQLAKDDVLANEIFDRVKASPSLQARKA